MRSTRANSFPFLKLPGEIRNRVYELCLISRTFNGSLAPVSPSQPALTRINRIVRYETLELFYASNRFRLSFRLIDPDIDSPGEEQRHLQFLRGIRNLVRNGYFQLMKELTIRVTKARASFVDMCDLRPTLRARVLKKEPHVLNCYPILKGPFLHDNLFFWVERLNVGDIDWGDAEAVDKAVESHKSKLCAEFVAEGDYAAAEELEHMPCGQMCEVLRALFEGSRLNENSQSFLFL